MTVLPKSLREANRYVLVHIATAKPCTLGEFTSALTGAITHLVGVTGLAKASLIVVADTFVFPTVAVKTSVDGLDSVRASLPFIKMIGTQPSVVHSVVASGQINKLTTLQTQAKPTKIVSK